MQEQQSIRFLLGHQLTEISDIRPTTTILEYLRGTQRLTGTKEGCAEGDCGACTVVIAEVRDEVLHYQACNACILFVPFLHGKQLITVEHLKDENGELHPVQQAMVDEHGSQCGFCTPGFVMSMFAMYHNDTSTDRASIDDALAGNLCRCTGYAPIVRAVRNSLTARQIDRFEQIEDETVLALNKINTGDTLTVNRDGQEYHAPSSIEALSHVLASQSECRIVAGSTDVGLWVTKQRQSLDCIVSVSNIKELKYIHIADNTITIGAATPLAEVMRVLSKYYPSLSELFRRFGSSQIRNVATIGGNVANGSPIGDCAPALIALGSTLFLSSVDGTRQLLAEDFFLDYGKQDRASNEFLEKINIPLPVPRQVFRVYKISKRFHQDISAVCGAFSMMIYDQTIQTARVCFGGMAATPRRAFLCEQTLTGVALTSPAIVAAKQALENDFSPISDFRGSARYRTLVAGQLLERVGRELMHGQQSPIWEAQHA